MNILVVVLLTLAIGGCGGGGDSSDAGSSERVNDVVTFSVVEPLFPVHRDHPEWPDQRNGPPIEGVMVTPLEGAVAETRVTDSNGDVTFSASLPLVVRLEKPGYVTIESTVAEPWQEIPLPNEWPEEAEAAIQQLGLAEVIDSGELVLRWGDDGYLANHFPEGVGGIYACPNIILQEEEDRNFMLAVLVHEAMHAWQGFQSVNPPCDTSNGWVASAEGLAWIAAMEKDLREVGPIPDFDDRETLGGRGFMALAEIPWENQAVFYSWWYMGPETGRLVEHPDWADKVGHLERLCRLGPNRCRYLEDRFGPPPPRP